MRTTAAATPSIMGTMTDDSLSLLTKEWLVTNGMGGYASGTLLGVATRRYHGLFVPDLPGRGRTLIIPRLDETVEAGTQTALLSGAEYAVGRIEHDGARYLKDIRREWQIPVWTFEVERAVFEKRIVAPHGQNTIYIDYRCLAGSMRLHLRPYLTYRMHDARLGEGHAGSFPVTINGGRYEIAMPDGAPSLKLCLRPHHGVFVADEVVSEGVSYRVDRDRGSEHIQDLFSPGYFTIRLTAGQSVALVASVEPWDMLDFRCEDIAAWKNWWRSRPPFGRTSSGGNSSWPPTNSSCSRERALRSRRWRKPPATKPGPLSRDITGLGIGVATP